MSPSSPSSTTAPVFRPGHTAVITGGASGIGLALARRCTALGMTVLVADRDGEALARCCSSDDGSTKGKMHAFRMDVAKLEEWEGLKAKVGEVLGGKINLLALNAGVGGPSGWDDPSSFRRILDANLYGVIHGLAALLPAVRATSPAAVVITGSKQGITNPPGNPAYNASKAAVKALAEHLHYDLRGEHEHNVRVHLLVPGWTFTGLTGGGGGGAPGKTKPEGAWWPEQVVAYLEEKMAEDKFYIVCPDGDVSEALDRRRMLWSAGDAVEGRPPLSRWREDWKDEAREWIEKEL